MYRFIVGEVSDRRGKWLALYRSEVMTSEVITREVTADEVTPSRQNYNGLLL
jgi:hypothetical protein